MTYESETPAGSRAGVSWKSLDCTSTRTGTSPANRAQDLISKQVLYRRLEPMIATRMIGGLCHG
jgi:hypothetical protein